MAADETADLAAAKALFEANLDAIRHRDQDAYLACYRPTETLTRTGPGGTQVGYREFAASLTDSWPDHFDAQDMQLVPIAPGVVYGSYRYRVVYGTVETTGRSERVLVATEDGWRIAVTTAFPDPPGTPPPDRAYVAMTLIDGLGGPPIEDAIVVVRNGTVDCAGPRTACVYEKGLPVTDLAGTWMTPGLVDAHVHLMSSGWADGTMFGAEGLDAATADAEWRVGLDRWLRVDLCAGVTAVLDLGGTPWTWELRRRLEKDLRAPHVAVSGPVLSLIPPFGPPAAEQTGLFMADEKAAREAVRYLAAHRSDVAKLWWLTPVPEDDFARQEAIVLAAGAEAKAAKLPLAVHATTLKEAKVALRAGARFLAHSVVDAPVDDEFLDLMRQNGAFYAPTFTVWRNFGRLFAAIDSGEPPAVDDPNGCLDAATQERLATTPRLQPLMPGLREMAQGFLAAEPLAAENLRKIHDAGLPVVLGTDAGSPLTLHGLAVQAELEALQDAGLPAADVLLAATRDAARAMGRDAVLGTIRKGRIADLLVLAEDPTRDVRAFRALRWVIRGGEMRPVEELRAPLPPTAP